MHHEEQEVKRVDGARPGSSSPANMKEAVFTSRSFVFLGSLIRALRLVEYPSVPACASTDVDEFPRAAARRKMSPQGPPRAEGLL